MIKKYTVLVLTVLFVMSCDPSSVMEATIENRSNDELTINFESATIESKTLIIPSGQEALFQDGFSTTGSFLEPFLMDYDSIYIQNSSNQILKIYKPETTGRNIYIIDDWEFSEPDKRVYRYQFLID